MFDGFRSEIGGCELDGRFTSIQSSYRVPCISTQLVCREADVDTFSHLQTLNRGMSMAVILPYTPKISSRWPLCTFLVRPLTTTTLNPSSLTPSPLRLGETVLDRDLERERERERLTERVRERDMDTSRALPLAPLAGDSGFGDLDLPRSDMMGEW